MSKRDTIIVAVLVNIGLLAVLFMFARNTSEDRMTEQSEVSYTLEDTSSVQMAPSSSPQEIPLVVETEVAPKDEVDEVLKSYTRDPAPQVVAPAPQPSVEVQVEAPRYVEVTIKRGDALEKIARAYGTTVEEIKRVNQLTNERLDIGQVLKVSASKSSKSAPTVQAASSTTAAGEAVYYTIKTGDNPWKIARQFKVRYEDILKLNNLNEEKARNLKVGDKVRVK